MEYNIDEKYIKGSPNPITIEGTKRIFYQMENCICKIYKKNGINGTGFFCKIPFPGQLNLLPVLITNRHILDNKDLEINKIIEITINDDKEKRIIKIDNSRIIFISQKLDVIFIEIKESIDKIYNFLNIDDDINNDEYILELTYRQKSVYILHYPNGGKIKVSYGLLN